MYFIYVFKNVTSNITIIIIIHIPYFTAVQLFSQQHGLTDQALLIHSSAKNVLTIRHVLSIAAFCISMYRAGRKR